MIIGLAKSTPAASKMARVSIADAQGAHARHEFFNWWNHVREVGAVIGNIIDIKKPRARNMSPVKFRQCIAVFIRQMPAGIQNAQVGML